MCIKQPITCNACLSGRWEDRHDENLFNLEGRKKELLSVLSWLAKTIQLTARAMRRIRERVRRVANKSMDEESGGLDGRHTTG